MNRIDKLFQEKKGNILTVYATAGYPTLNDTLPCLVALEKNGADLIEIGVPFSDPLADGPTIQASSEQALRNGMNLKLLFEQLRDMRKKITIPVVLMGYFNPVMQFGVEAFCKKCAEVGIDGLVLPDLPFDVYESEFRDMFASYGLANVLLITPQTSEERIRKIDNAATGFIYMVSTASTTGARKDISESQVEYFKRIRDMQLKTPRQIGFGISDKKSFDTACTYADGAIIGSAFIKAVAADGELDKKIEGFIHAIKA